MPTQTDFSTTINNKFLDKHNNWVMEGYSDIRRNTDDSYTFIMGATDWKRGSHIILNGMNSTRSSGDARGAFEIVANDANSDSRLIGKPIGTLTWRNQNIVCVTQWHNDVGGFYRKYSDGFIEQGGYCDWSSASGVVTLHTPFSNTMYNIQLTDYTYSNNNASMVNVYYNTLPTTTQFNISVRDHGNGVYARPFYWYCIGY